MRVSVIVPAFNEERVLAASLASVRRAMAPFAQLGWAHELIVCDNNSTDRTAEIAREAGATVVFEPVNQISRARNAGARCASGEWLIFVDADSHPSPELFAAVAAEIERGRCLAGGSTVRFDDRRHLALRVGEAGWNTLSRLTRWAAGSFIFCDAAAFRCVGGFSERLFASEEIDLFRRLKKLARAQRRTIRILSRHPLRTSARKQHLYDWRAMWLFMIRTALSGGRTLRSRDECFAWYDGRR